MPAMISKSEHPILSRLLVLLLTLSSLPSCVTAAVSPVGAVTTTTTVLLSTSTALTTSPGCSDCSPLVDAQQAPTPLPTTFPTSGEGAPPPSLPASPYTNNTTATPTTTSTSILPTDITTPSAAAAVSTPASSPTSTVISSSSSISTTQVATTPPPTTISVSTSTPSSVATNTPSSAAPTTPSSVATTPTSSSAAPAATSIVSTSIVSEASTSIPSLVASVSSVQAPASAQLASTLTAIVGSSAILIPAIVPISSPTASSIEESPGSTPNTTAVVPVFAIGTQSITAGGPVITVSGVAVSLAPSATAVVLGTSIEAIAPPIPVPVLTVAGVTVTANSASVFVVGTQTVVPGAPQITISGTPVSLEPSGYNVVIAGSTQALVPPAPAPVLTIAGSTVTANSEGQYTVDHTQLIPGAAPITVSGTPISLAPSAAALVVGTNTEVLSQAAASPTVTVSPPTQAVILPVLTLAGSAITPNAMSNYIVAGQTLSPGAPPITLSGVPISLAPSASNLVIGTSTELVTVTLLPKPTNRLPAVDNTGKGPTLAPLPLLQLWLGLLGIILLCAAF